MSAGTPLRDEPASGGSETNQIPSDRHICDDEHIDAKVFVNDVRVPVGDVDIHMRKEGPLSATRYAEGTLASPFEGTDYINTFGAVDENNQDNFDTIRVDVRDYETDEFYTQFQGIVTGLGNGSGPERIWHWRAQGLGLQFGTIDVGYEFESQDGITSDRIASIIVNELNRRFANNAFAINPSVGDNIESYEGEGGGSAARYLDAQSGPTVEADFPTTKTFTANRHTLTDVAQWFEETFEVYTYIDPVPENPTFRGVTVPHFGTHNAHYLGGNLNIINNDALSELRPVNTLLVKGSAQDSSGPLNDLLSSNEPADEYAYAIARHEELYQRAGEIELRADTVESDSRDKQGVEREAKNKLKKAIDEASSGDMITLPRAPIAPFDIVEAKPTCDGNEATDVPSVTYEVHRVHHRIRGGERSTTKLNVGVHTNVVEDIEIAESGMDPTNP